MVYEYMPLDICPPPLKLACEDSCHPPPPVGIAWVDICPFIIFIKISLKTFIFSFSLGGKCPHIPIFIGGKCPEGGGLFPTIDIHPSQSLQDIR